MSLFYYRPQREMSTLYVHKGTLAMANGMDRRKLLRAGAAVFAATRVATSEGQPVSHNTPGPFLVRADEARPGLQWSIHGEKAFSTKVSAADTEQKYLLVEVHTPPGHGPELHIHPGQNELFFVLKGSIGVQCGPARTTLRAGDAFMAPADVPHAFVTLGTEPAHLLNLFDPAGQMESFFADYAPVVNVEGEPDRKELGKVYERNGLRVVGPRLKASSFTN